MLLATADGSYTSVNLATSPGSPYDLIRDGLPTLGQSVQLLDHISGRSIHKAYGAVYRSNPWAKTAVKARSRDLGRLHMLVHNKGELADKHDRNLAGQLIRALERPIDRIGPAMRWQGTALDKHIWGNALWEILEDSAGRLFGFKRIPWSFIEVHDELGRDEVYYTDHSTPLAPRILQPWQVIHFGLMIDPDRVCESSPFEALSATLRLHDAITRQVVAWFSNAMRPSGVMQLPIDATEKQYELAMEFIRAYYAGPENSGRPLVTSAQYKALDNDPAHSNAVELAKQSRDEILMALERPPTLAGVLESGARANVVELTRHYTRNTVGGDATMLEEQLFEQLHYYRPAMSDVTGMFDLDTATRAPFEERMKAYPEALRVMTPNEIRVEIEGRERNESPYADELWSPLNHGPISLAGQANNASLDDPPDPDPEPPTSEEDDDDD